MPSLFGTRYTRSDLLRRVGDLSQVAGVSSTTLEDGWQRGVRSIGVRTGSGLRYDVLLDRGADVGLCEFNARSLSWMPPMRFPGPWYYEPNEAGWLRTGLGGLCNTAGLTHIGGAVDDDVTEYRRPGNPKEHFGVHGRAAHIPAELLSCGEEWQGDECELHVTARIRQASSYGENLVLTRRYSSMVGESRISIHDEIVNEGFNDTYFAMLYHFNVGFPILDDGAEMLLPVEEFLGALFNPSAGDEAYFRYPAPVAGHHVESAEFRLRPDADGKVTAAVVNPALDGGFGMYVTWDFAQMPIFHTARSVTEGLYFIGVEPTTNQFDRIRQKELGLLRVLAPGDRVVHDLEVGVIEGSEAIGSLRERLGPR